MALYNSYAYAKLMLVTWICTYSCFLDCSPPECSSQAFIKWNAVKEFVKIKRVTKLPQLCLDTMFPLHAVLGMTSGLLRIL
jgi:hypothetical protein